MDVLVLVDEPRRFRPKIPYSVHLQIEDKKGFAQRFVEGDDYIVSAVRFGKLLYDRSNFWKTIREGLQNVVWPDPRRKINYCERRIRLGNQLLAMGDTEAAREEYLFAAAQLARAILLRRGVYPLSRPELSRQLLDLSHNELANDIHTLIEGECGKKDLQRIANDLTQVLDRARPALTSLWLARTEAKSSSGYLCGR